MDMADDNNHDLLGRLVRKDVHLLRSARGPLFSSSSASSSSVDDVHEMAVVSSSAGSSTAMTTFPAEMKLRRDKFTVGRSNSVDCCILSPNISKIHALFRWQSVGGVMRWTVTDCKSMNGVFVNSMRIPPNIARILSPLDEVCFQVKTDDPRTTYVYQLEAAAAAAPSDVASSVGVVPMSVRPSPGRPASSTSSQPDVDVVDDECDTPKRMKLLQRADDVEIGPNIRALQVHNELLQDKLAQAKREYEENLHDQADGAAAREAEMKLRLEKLEEQLEQAEFRVREAQRDADEEKAKYEATVARLSEEKAQVEEENCKLEAAVLVTSDECRELGDKLQAMEAAVAVSQKSNLATVLRNMLENECQCSICSELFYKTTTLQCSHSYCEHCISEWQKKKSDCPICRQPISAFVPTLVVDAFIDRTVDMLPADVKTRREENVAERNNLKAQANVAAVAAAATTSSNRRRTRTTHRRTRGSAANTPLQLPPAPHQPPPLPRSVAAAVIELSSSPSDTSMDDETSSTEEFDNDSDAGSEHRPYYGGYGHCFVCGEIGHWANGCPYR